MNNLDAYLILNAVPGLGPARIGHLVEYCGTAQRVLSCSRMELCKSGLIPETVADQLGHFPQDRFLKEEHSLMTAHGSWAVTQMDADYPELLRSIPSAPVVLYIKGRTLPEHQAAVALVGSRRASVYGITMVEQLAMGLSQLGITVVSGLARGIDAHAHLGAIRAQGQTIGVLGNGLSHVYPMENRDLYEKIPRFGAVVSEFPMAMAPVAKHFPRRNRIVSGLSMGVVVVEASEKSGALITADFALEQNREVFAVPGPVGHPNSRGVHRLIKQGAKLVGGLEDILEELRPKLESYVNLDRENSPENSNPVSAENFTNGFSIQEEIIYNLLNSNAAHVDQIAQSSGLSVAEVSAVLLSMELKKTVRQLPGKYFERLNKKEPYDQISCHCRVSGQGQDDQ